MKFVGEEWLSSKTGDNLSMSPYGHEQEERMQDLKRIGELVPKMSAELTECFFTTVVIFTGKLAKWTSLKTV